MDLSTTPSSSRILYDVPCAVCRDHSSGKHYGVYACDGCAGFFKRSVRRQRSYVCKARAPGRCLVDKTHRNQCRACRMDKCIDVGMNRDAVQHERGPRNSTIRRQMALFINDHTSPNQMGVPIQPVSETVIPKSPLLPPPPPLNIFYPYLCSRIDLPNPSVIPYGRTLPSPPLPLLAGLLMTKDPAEICEAAAKLLFMNVKWAKGIPAFENLPSEDREYLLGETWKDLFVIGAVQYLYPLDLKVLINVKNSMINLKDVELFQTAMAEIARMRPYVMEFSCLRGIMLFKTNPNQRTEDEDDKLQDSYSVAAEQERNKNILTRFVSLTHPLERLRGSQLLELVRTIRRVSGEIIVDLFFRPTIGNIPIERIICDMYKTA